MAQIKLLGSDGKQYIFLAKPKDDLRKDNRMMEMNGILNRLLAKQPASRRRSLHLRRCEPPPRPPTAFVYATEVVVYVRGSGAWEHDLCIINYGGASHGVSSFSGSRAPLESMFSLGHVP